MICPKCENINRCDCENCNLGNDTKDLIILDMENGMYECSFCGHKFQQQESMELEWDNLLNSFSEEFTSRICIKWYVMDMMGRRTYEKLLDTTDYPLTQAFIIHFKKHPDDFTCEDLLQAKRNINIQSIL